MISTLTRTQVIKLSRALKAEGRKLPKVGWCAKIGERMHDGPGRGEVCRDRTGYYWTAKPKGFDGARKAKTCKRVKRGRASFTVCK
jgi:hypothetical protein